MDQWFKQLKQDSVDTFVQPVKKALSTDFRSFATGQPIAPDERGQVLKLTANFQMLLHVVNRNYRKYIDKTIDYVHLRLHSDKIIKLAKAYHATPELVDQLIRIKAIGQREADRNWELRTSIDRKYRRNVELNRFQVLYDSLFGESNYISRMMNGTTLYKTTIDSHTAYYVLQQTNERQWNVGIIQSKAGLLEAPITASSFSVLLCKHLQTHGDILFYNFESFRTPDVLTSPTKTKFIVGLPVAILGIFLLAIYIVTDDQINWPAMVVSIAAQITQYALPGLLLCVMIIVAWYLLHSSSLDPMTGLLKHCDYAGHDPNCIVMRYRPSGEHFYMGINYFKEAEE